MASDKEFEWDCGSDEESDNESTASVWDLECKIIELKEDIKKEREEFSELENDYLLKCEEHKILQSKYKDLLARFEGLSAKVRAFVEG